MILNVPDVMVPFAVPSPQGVIPLGGCVVTATEDLGMPWAITVGLDGFTVRAFPHSTQPRFPLCF